MPALPVIWGETLKAEYTKLFETCKVHDKLTVRRSNDTIITINCKATADDRARRIHASKARYEKIAKQAGGSIPWWVVGCLHMMECGLSFSKHLHNGDPLTAKTVKVPAGRPAKGMPPFAFDDSAVDALQLKSFHLEKDWSIARFLYKCELFNGLGYRQYHPHVKSPYLWSFTSHYTKGKYYADGKWSETLVSEQLGIAAVLKRLVELGFVTL